jgi:hypothetical protein
MFKLLTVFVLTIAISATTLAGIKLEYNYYDNNDKFDATTNIVIMTETEMLIENNTTEGRVTMFYNAEIDNITVVNHTNKQYMKFSKKKLESLKKQITGYMDQVKQQLANLPDAQRKQMEKMMEQQMGGISTTEYTVSKTGNSENINGWSTTKYELKADGSKNSEIWATDFNQLDINENDFNIMKKFSEFTATMLDAIPNTQKDPFSAIYDEFKGLPVRTVNIKTNSVSELSRVEQYGDEIDLVIPSDYTEQSLDLPNRR